jgi:hypothetical protein
MRQDVGETREVSRLELVRRAKIYGDLQAWDAFQQSLEETVLIWLHAHPGSEAACRVQSERHFVALAFEQLRQAVFQGKVTCETLSEVLVYLRASLNAAILETRSVSRRPAALSERIAGEQDLEGHLESQEFWGQFAARLSSDRERRLAYLLYSCGLQPSEIVRCCPQEWSDVHEITRLRRIILERERRLASEKQ